MARRWMGSYKVGALITLDEVVTMSKAAYLKLEDNDMIAFNKVMKNLIPSMKDLIEGYEHGKKTRKFR